MITELIIASGIVYCINKLYNSKNDSIKKEFNEIMESIGIHNKINQTFKIHTIINKKYGYNALITIPKGLSFNDLENKINILEDNLNAIVKLDKSTFNKNIIMYVVNKDINRFDFEPVYCKENEIYLGKDYKGDSCIVNMDKKPHLLIAGATGYGKTMLISCILTNLIYNSQKKTELYLSQLAKSEISIFDKCKNVKMTAYTPNEMMVMLDKLVRILDKRSNMFSQHNIRNINQWNKNFKNRYVKRIYLFCEEMSELMDLDEDKLFYLIKEGRSIGIHVIGVLQRSTATNINTDCKSQMTRITFHQNSKIDSQNIINSNSATNLKEGECIYCSSNGEVKVKIPFVDEDFVILNKYVSEIKMPNLANPVISTVSEDENLDKNIILSENEAFILQRYDIVDTEYEEVKNNEESIVEVQDIPNLDDKKANNNKRKRKGVINIEEIDKDDIN